MKYMRPTLLTVNHAHCEEDWARFNDLLLLGAARPSGASLAMTMMQSHVKTLNYARLSRRYHAVRLELRNKSFP